MGISVKLTFVVLSGLVLSVESLDNKRQCFDLGEKNICYFWPNVVSVNWETAWKTCRDLKATLPVIADKAVQSTFVSYFDGDRFSILPVWTAGRYIGDNKWKWSNGQAFRGTEKPLCPFEASSCPHESRAILSKVQRYEARTPYSEYAYICSFTGANCSIESSELTRWGAGCLKFEKFDRQRLNGARNKCIERGGDLATFSEHEDHSRLQQLLPYDMFKNPDTDYWIGLHRKWWIWNATDVQDIKYNLLKTYADDRLDCLFITDRSNEWKREPCANTKNVICQTVSYPKEMTSTTNVIIGSVIAVLTLAIIIVVLLVLVKKRGNVAEVNPDSGSLTNPVTKQQNTAIQCPDDTYATIDLDDDLENLNYENGPNPSTLYTKVDICDGPSGVYSEPISIPALETNRSTTAVYSEPYGSSSAIPVPKNLVGPSSVLCSEVNKPGQQKKSAELTSPPIKIGPKGDIYTLPISHN